MASFTHILVDRARTISRVATPFKADGATTFAPAISEWFKARLMVAPSREAADGGGVNRVVLRPTLLYGTKDVQGDRLHIDVEDRIEVESKQFGIEVYQLDGDPEPLRESRNVIGYQASLRRIEEHAGDVALTTLRPVGKSLGVAYGIVGVKTVGRSLEAQWKVGV